MRYILYIILFNIFLFGNYAPKWYHNLPSKKIFYIGYGSGNSEIEAKANARSDISSSISVSVDSIFSKQAKQEQANLSKTKLSLDEFAYADSEIIQDEKYKNFDSLIEYLDDKTFSSIKVSTKPKISN